MLEHLAKSISSYTSKYGWALWLVIFLELADCSVCYHSFPQLRQPKKKERERRDNGGAMKGKEG